VIIVQRAPAYATIQDEGRRGFISSGVPRAGAMDVTTLRTLDAILGNRSGSAAVEWALTAGALSFSARAVFAIGGAVATVKLNDTAVEPYRAYQASPEDTLTIEAPSEGRFLYLCFAGGIDVPRIMQSRSTYVPGGFGGLDGRRLRNGDTLQLGARSPKQPHVADALPASLRNSVTSTRARFVPADPSITSVAGEWSVSASSDRTGYRLTGRTSNEGASITSRGVCPGTIQLPPGGEPIVLMADAPTVGGYRVAGAVATADLGKFAQLTPGVIVSFEAVTIDAAQRLVLDEAERIQRIRDWALG
jgi:5-oxoprolinase (ATP-hydrolysing) subunit C